MMFDHQGLSRLPFDCGLGLTDFCKPSLRSVRIIAHGFATYFKDKIKLKQNSTILIHVVALILVLWNFNELEIYEKPSYRINCCYLCFHVNSTFVSQLFLPVTTQQVNILNYSDKRWSEFFFFFKKSRSLIAVKAIVSFAILSV